MKKYSVFIICLIVATVLCACNVGDNPSDPMHSSGVLSKSGGDRGSQLIPGLVSAETGDGTDQNTEDRFESISTDGAFLLDLSENSSDYGDLYHSFVTDAGNGVSGLSVEENDLWNGLRFKEDITDEMVLEFEGKTYTVLYRDSLYYPLTSYATRRYTDSDGNTFGVRDNDGALVLVNFYNKDYIEQTSKLADVDDPEKTAQVIAEGVLGRLFGKLEGYTRVVEKGEREQTFEGRPEFWFVTYYKTVSGYKTSDFFTVRVDSRGRFVSLIVGDQKVFDDRVVSVDHDAVNDSLRDKIVQVYADTDYKLISAEVNNQHLAITPDGKVVVLSRLAVGLVSADGTEYTSGIELVTFVE